MALVDIAPHLESQSPKTPISGACMGIFEPNSRNKQHAFYRNYCTDSHQILHQDKDHQMLFVGGPNTRTINPRWRTAAILGKNKKSFSRYICNGLTNFDGIWQGDVFRHCAPPPAAKNSRF